MRWLMTISFKSKMGGTSALTLALSPGAREQPLAASSNSDGHRAAGSRSFAKTRGAFLPLRSFGRRGEGRGEVRFARRVRTTNGAHPAGAERPACFGAWNLGTSLVLGCWCLVLLFCPHSNAQSYTIDWYKIAGGAGTSTGGVYTVNGTIGQPDAGGTMSGGGYSLTGGFWSLYAVQNPGAPVLSIILTATNTAMVYWPSPSTGYNLQVNTDLTTANWTAVTETVNDNGTIKYIIVNPPTGNRFYRLKQ